MNAQDLYSEPVDAFEFPFESPRYYNRQHKLDIIHHYWIQRHNKGDIPKDEKMLVFRFEVDKKFKKEPVFIIDKYIEEHNINLHYYAEKILNSNNAQALMDSCIMKINNNWREYSNVATDIDIYTI